MSTPQHTPEETPDEDAADLEALREARAEDDGTRIPLDDYLNEDGKHHEKQEVPET